MKRIKEKCKAIKRILMAGQYAVYVINNGYTPGCKGKGTCLISDNASELFLETIVKFTQKVIDGEVKEVKDE